MASVRDHVMTPVASVLGDQEVVPRTSSVDTSCVRRGSVREAVQPSPSWTARVVLVSSTQPPVKRVDVMLGER